MTEVATIKERLSLVDIVGRRVRLTPAGRYLKGLCPFHSEKTPSFFVFPETNTFKCFGCSEGGDVFTFVMKTESLDFREVLKRLAQEAGVPLPARPEGVPGEAKAVLGANAAAAEYFHGVLQREPTGAKAREYTARRGLDAAIIEKFQLGCAPAGWDNLTSHLRALGFKDEMAEAAGLARRGDQGIHDTFRDRLIFPITSARGEVVGFGGRTLGDDPAKYLNTPKTAAFDKGSLLYAFNLARDAIRATGTVVMVEGYMDAIAAHQHGFANVVASMGTSITPAQMWLLEGNAKRLVLCLDADAAGVAATRRSLEALAERPSVGHDPFDERRVDLTWLVQQEAFMDRGVFVASLPEGQDPDQFIRSDRAGWERAVAEATPLADYLFTSVLKDVQSESVQGRAEALAKLAPLIRDIAHPVVRRQYSARLARALNMTEGDVDREVHGRIRPNLRPRRIESKNDSDVDLGDYLLALGLHDPALLGEILDGLTDEDLVAPETRLLAANLRTMEGKAPAAEAEAMREALDPALAGRLAAIQKLRYRLPPLEGEALFEEMQGVALRLKRQRLRAENRRIQLLLAEGKAGLKEAELGIWQRRILAEMRELQISMRQLGAIRER